MLKVLFVVTAVLAVSASPAGAQETTYVCNEAPTVPVTDYGTIGSATPMPITIWFSEDTYWQVQDEASGLWQVSFCTHYPPLWTPALLASPLVQVTLADDPQNRVTGHAGRYRGPLHLHDTTATGEAQRLNRGSVLWGHPTDPAGCAGIGLYRGMIELRIATVSLNAPSERWPNDPNQRDDWHLVVRFGNTPDPDPEPDGNCLGPAG